MRFVLLALTVLAACGCAGKEPPQPIFSADMFAQDNPDLPAQVVTQLHLIGWRETVAADSPFPALGFTLKNDVVTATDAPATVAGVRMLRDDFKRWVEALATGGGATMYMAPIFTVTPLPWSEKSGADGKYFERWHVAAEESSLSYGTIAPGPAVAQEIQEMRYLAGWTIGDEMATPEYRQLQPGFMVSLHPRLTGDPERLLIHVEAMLRGAKTEDHVVLDRFSNKAGEIKLQLPRVSEQAVSGTAVVTDKGSAIVAHYVRQFRDASGAPVRDHLFYIVSAGRIGQRDEEAPFAAAPEAVPVQFSWSRWFGDSSENPSGPTMTPEELRRALSPFIGDPGAEKVDVAICGLPGETVSFRLGDSISYVAGIDPDPKKGPPPYEFNVKEAFSGVRFQAEIGSSIHVEGSIGGKIALVSAGKVLPSVRPGAAPDDVEKYFFQAPQQSRADFTADFTPAEPPLRVLLRQSGFASDTQNLVTLDAP